MEYIIYYEEKNSKENDEMHEIISADNEDDAIRKFKHQYRNVKIVDIDEY